MNPSKNIRSSGQGENLQNTIPPNLLGDTVVNTVLLSQTQNPAQSIKHVVNNPTVKSNYSSNMKSSQAISIVNNPSNQKDLSLFKTVQEDTKLISPQAGGNNNRVSQNPNYNRNSVQNTLMKNGKVLNNIDINGDAQSPAQSLVNNPNQNKSSQMNNPQNNYNLPNQKAQSIHVSKDKSSIYNQSTNSVNMQSVSLISNSKNPAQSTMKNTLNIQSTNNGPYLQSQNHAMIGSNINNINSSNQPMNSSLPIPPTNNLSQNNTIFQNQQSIQPISGNLQLQDNNKSMRYKSTLNNPANPQISHIPNTNPYQSAMINQHHQNLPLQSQNMKSVQSNIQQSGFPNPNSSVKNSLTPQQQQSIMRNSQQVKQSSMQSQMNNSVKSQVNQNPNISVHNSKLQQMQESMKKSEVQNSLRNSDIKASRNKSPPRVVRDKNGQMVSIQSDNNGNAFYTTEADKQLIKASIKITDDKHDEVKNINNNIKGSGFRFYGNISKAGRNQTGQKKTNQDTSLVHLNVGQIKGFNLFGVLDGHGPDGHFVSQFCRDYFIMKIEEYTKHCLEENINTPEKIYEKLKKSNFSYFTECFKGADVAIMSQNRFDYNFSGTTCNLVFQFNKYLVCASVGDSRGILIFDDNTNTNKGIYNLSNDHKPDLPQEMDRILQNGGMVDKLTDQYGSKVGPFRVFRSGLTYPGLAMSRSLGDFQAKECGVITDPEINEYKISHIAKYMIICSDGVWEFLTNDNVRDLGNIYFKQHDIGQLCSNLLKTAVNKWEENDIIRDDITIVCVFF